MSNSDTKNQPVQEIRLGLIKAVIWANPTKNNGTMHNVTLARLYRDADDKWQESASFRRDDLLLTRKVLDAAHSWICQTEQERSAYESAAASAR
jgi:hypothetical protein